MGASNNNKGMSWFSALARVNYGVCVAMAAVAFVLLEPRLLDLGVAVEPRRWSIVSFFLIYAALVLGFETAFPRATTNKPFVDMFLVFVIGTIPLMGVGLILLVLAGQALFADPVNHWVALLAVPGLLSFVTMHYLDIEARTAANAAEDGAQETSADSGKVNVRGAAIYNLLTGAVMAVHMVVFVAWMGAMFWLYIMLAAVLFTGERFDANKIESALAAFWPKLVPIAIAGGAVMLTLVPLMGIGVVLSQWFARRDARNANRDLTPSEIAFIDSSEETVRRYAEERRYAKGYWLNAWGFLVAMLAGFGGVFALLFNADRWLGEVATRRSDGGDVFIYIDGIGVSLVIALFAAIVWAALPAIIAGRLSRRLAEASAWQSLGIKNDYFSVKGRLTTLVRTGRLSPSAPFDPGRFLFQASRMFEAYALYPAIALTLLTFVFWQLDRGKYDLITERYVEVVNYWTQQPTQFAFNEVERVALQCTFGKNDATNMAYWLYLPGGDAVDMMKGGKLEDRLGDYEKVDGKLVAAGVKFEFDVDEPLFGEAVYAYHPQCVEEVARRFDPATAERIKRLMRLDVWERL